MKKLLLFFFTLSLLANPSYVWGENNDQEEFLPIGLTEEEMLRLDEIGINHRNTRDPEGEVRNPAEW